MDKLTASRIAGGNTAYKRAASDYYPTPPEVTKALMDFLKIPEGSLVWEPACGEGHMVRVLESAGMRVIESDIKTGENFLSTEKKDCDWIITNPPFSIADKFIERCVEHEKPFALLLKSQYWHAKKRLDLFRKSQPDYVLPLTWRPDFLFGERGGGSPLMDVMWVVWEKKDTHSGTMYIPLEKPVLKGDCGTNGRTAMTGKEILDKESE